MIPSLVVDEVRDSLVEYLASTFALADDDVQMALSDFLKDSADGIFRGPYLRVRTPFAAVDDSWMAQPRSTGCPRTSAPTPIKRKHLID